MYLITLEQLKKYLHLTTASADLDTALQEYLLSVCDFIIDYTGNAFIDQRVTFTGDIVLKKSAGTLEAAFGGVAFKADTLIRLIGSIYNDAVYKVAQATNTLITIDGAYAPISFDETAVSAKLALLRVPKGLESVIVAMVTYNLEQTSWDTGDQRVKSERFNSYSKTSGDGVVVTNASTSTAYPKNILMMLEPYIITESLKGVVFK